MKDSINKKNKCLNPAATVTAIITRRIEGVLHVLLTLRAIEPFKNVWCLPGGHINKFESSYDAIVREVEEETGLMFKGEYLGSFDEIFEDLEIHNVVAAYAGSCVGMTSSQKSEVSGLRWVSLDEVRGMTLAFTHNKVLDAFAQWNNSSRDGLLEEFRALRGEIISIFNARLWGTATYLILVIGIITVIKGNLRSFHWLFLIYASIPFILHTAYRERARIRAGVYIKEKIEPYIRGLDWENYVDNWRCSLKKGKNKSIIDRILHMTGIGGLYVLVISVAVIKCLTTVFNSSPLLQSRVFGLELHTVVILVLCFLGLLLAGLALMKFFSLYRKIEDKSVEVCTKFNRNPPVY